MNRVVFWLRACAGGAGFGLALAWLVTLRVLPVSNAYRRQSFARLGSWLCCRALGLRLTIVGREQVGRSQPCVYVCNHQSHLDYAITGSIFPGSAIVVAREIGSWAVLGLLFRSTDNIMFDRDVPVRAAAAVSEAEKAIRDRRLSVWMFAEGTRGKERGRLGPFKRGAFRVAVATGVPIVPVVISPLKPQTDLRARRLTPHDVVIQVLDPVFAAGSTHEDENRLGNEVWNRMQRCLETY